MDTLVKLLDVLTKVNETLTLLNTMGLKISGTLDIATLMHLVKLP